MTPAERTDAGRCPACGRRPNTTAGADAAPACSRHRGNVVRVTPVPDPTPTGPVPGRRNRWTSA